MSTTILETIQKAGATLALDGDSLRLRSARGSALDAELLATVRAHKPELLAELREKKLEEQQALFEIALEYAKQFADESFKFLGGFKHASSKGLHTSYCESLARIMRGLVAPIGQAAFGELLLQAELNQERQAIQSTDNATESTTETSLRSKPL